MVMNTWRSHAVQGSGFKVHGTGLKVPAFALRAAARHARQAPSASWEAKIALSSPVKFAALISAKYLTG